MTDGKGTLQDVRDVAGRQGLFRMSGTLMRSGTLQDVRDVAGRQRRCRTSGTLQDVRDVAGRQGRCRTSGTLQDVRDVDTELPAAEEGQASEAVDNSGSRPNWADLSQDAPVLTSDPSEAAPPIGPAAEEETDPALQSLVTEEAAFGASASPPSPELEPRFDALSLLAPAKEEEVTFEALTAELEGVSGVVEPGPEETAVSCEEDPITHPESENPENTADLESSNPLEPHREPDSDRTLSPVEVSEFPEFPDWGEGVPEEVAQEGTEESRAAAPVYVQFSEEAEEEVPPPPTSPFLVSEGAAAGAPTTEPIQVGHSASAPSRPPREKRRGTKGGIAKRRSEQIHALRRLAVVRDRFPADEDSDVGESAVQRAERRASREAAAKAPQEPRQPPPGWTPSLRPLSHSASAAASTARSSTDTAPGVSERAAPKRPKSPSKAATSVKHPKPAEPRKASAVAPLRDQPPVPPPNRPAPVPPPPVPKRLSRTSGEPRQPPAAIPPPPSHPPPSRTELERRETRGRTTVVEEAAHADKSAAPQRVKQRTGRSRTPVVGSPEDPGVHLLRQARQHSVPPAPHSLGGRPAALRPTNPQYPKTVTDRSGTWAHSGGTGGSVRPPATIPVFTGTAGEPYDQSDPYSLSDEVWRRPELIGGSTALVADRTIVHQITEPEGLETEQAPYHPRPLRRKRRSQTVTLRERRSAFKVRCRTSTTRPEPDPVEPTAPEEDDDLEEIEVEAEPPAAADDPSSEPPEAPEELGDEEEGEEEEQQEEDVVVEEAAEAPQDEHLGPEVEAEQTEPSLPTTLKGSVARFLASTPPNTPPPESAATETRSRSRHREPAAGPVARTVQATNVTGRLEIQTFRDGRKAQVFVPDTPIPKVPPQSLKRSGSAPVQPKVKPPPAGLVFPPKRASSAAAASVAAAPAPQGGPGPKLKEHKAPPKPKLGEILVETRAYEPGYESSPEPTPEQVAEATERATRARDKKYAETVERLAQRSRDEQLKEYLEKEHRKEEHKKKGTKVRPPPKAPPLEIPPRPTRPAPKGPQVEVPIPQSGGAASSSSAPTIAVPKPNPPPTPPPTPKAAGSSGPHPWNQPQQPAHPPPAATRERAPERPPLTEEEQTQARLRRYRQETARWYARDQRSQFIDPPAAVPSHRLKVFFDWHDTLDCALNNLKLFD
eukprot:s4356_g1.t1